MSVYAFHHYAIELPRERPQLWVGIGQDWLPAPVLFVRQHDTLKGILRLARSELHRYSMERRTWFCALLPPPIP